MASSPIISITQEGRSDLRCLNGKRKTKGSGVQPQALTGLGKAISQMSGGKEAEVEYDLGEIRRGAKKRRVAAGGMNKS